MIVGSYKRARKHKEKAERLRRLARLMAKRGELPVALCRERQAQRYDRKASYWREPYDSR